MSQSGTIIVSLLFTIRKLPAKTAMPFTAVSSVSILELLESEDAGHHVSGLAGGQVVRLPGGIPTTLAPHHPGLCRGGHRDAKHSVALSGTKSFRNTQTSASLAVLPC